MVFGQRGVSVEGGNAEHDDRAREHRDPPAAHARTIDTPQNKHARMLWPGPPGTGAVSGGA